ncbi:MAG: ABC transporter ATP-binding protein/permease [Defluviitaleaceae bacterium]|nr:ABC transporter ATP-binding protein/permease [Defluviitaleaceae bacterium]
MINLKNLTFKRTLGIPFKVAPVEIGVNLIEAIISLAITPVSVLVTAYFIDTAITVVTEGESFDRIIPPLVLMAVFSIYWYILNPLTNLVRQSMNIKARLALRIPFLEKRVRLEYKHAENKDTIDLINRVWNNPEGQLMGVFDTTLNFIFTLGRVISIGVIVLINAPLAGLILFVLSAPIFIISIKAGKDNYQAHKEATLDARWSWNIYWVLTARETAAERNMFGFVDFLSEKFQHYFEANRKHVLKTNFKWFARSKASSILLGLLSAAGLFVMAPSVAAGTLSVGMFISIQGALFSLINMIGWNLPYIFELFTTQREYLKESNQYFDLSEIEGAESLPVVPPPEFKSLEFKNVSFSYPGTEKVILDELSLKMEKGKHYSFVGVNGAGKTTLIKLITRLYDDYTGEILLNGKSLREWELPQIKGMFCALFQDFAQFDITVAENAAIGKINGASEAEIENALELANFDKVAEELKDGVNTLLGKTHEDGIELSGGQWQRLAFARAIISPAPVKILDEPTAALDPIAESQVYAQFESIAKDFTTIFISHRLASAKLADVIFVLKDGKLAEQGSHEELVGRGEMYAEMFESQKSWYM